MPKQSERNGKIMKKGVIIICVTLVLLISYIIVVENDIKSSDKQVLELAKLSIQNQYGENVIDKEALYTAKFIKKMTDPNNAISYGNNLNILDLNIFQKNQSNTEYWVKATIEDSKGQYIQHIYIHKERGQFLIDDIQTDI